MTPAAARRWIELDGFAQREVLARIIGTPRHGIGADDVTAVTNAALAALVGLHFAEPRCTCADFCPLHCPPYEDASAEAKVASVVVPSLTISQEPSPQEIALREAHPQCTCKAIMTADEHRHFKGCPKREELDAKLDERSFSCPHCSWAHRASDPVITCKRCSKTFHENDTARKNVMRMQETIDRLRQEGTLFSTMNLGLPHALHRLLEKFDEPFREELRTVLLGAIDELCEASIARREAVARLVVHHVMRAKTGCTCAMLMQDNERRHFDGCSHREGLTEEEKAEVDQDIGRIKVSTSVSDAIACPHCNTLRGVIELQLTCLSCNKPFRARDAWELEFARLRAENERLQSVIVKLGVPAGALSPSAQVDPETEMLRLAKENAALRRDVQDKSAKAERYFTDAKRFAEVPLEDIVAAMRKANEFDFPALSEKYFSLARAAKALLTKEPE